MFVNVTHHLSPGELTVLPSKPKLYSTLLYTQKLKRREGKADALAENEIVNSH